MRKKSLFRTLLLISLGFMNPNSIGIANLPKENIWLRERLENYPLFKEKAREEFNEISIFKHETRSIESLLMPKNKNLIRNVIYAESSDNYYEVSRCGAVGLMQLMPKTAVENGISPDRIYKFEEYGAGCDTTYGRMLIAARDRILNAVVLRKRLF